MKSAFLKQAGLLFSGSLVAQVIGVVVTPVLTRLYSPEEFGPVILFTALVSIFSNISGLRFEQAIVVAQTEKKAKDLLQLGMVTNLGFILLFSLISIVMQPYLCRLFQLDSAPWLYAVAPVFGITGIMECLLLWNNRQRKFSKISTNRIITASGAAGYKLMHPFMAVIPGNGLIIGHIAGQLFGIIHLAKNAGRTVFRVDWSVLKRTFREFRQFPGYSAPAALLNILALRMPEILISVFDGKAATGFYGNASKLTYLPMSLLAMAVGQVFFERIARLREDKEASARISIALFDFLWLLGLIPVGIVAVWGEALFGFVLGAEWGQSGTYASILIYFYFAMFLTSSFSSAFEAYNKLKVQLLYNLGFLLVTSGAMVGSYLYGLDTLTALTIFTICGVILRFGILNYFFQLFGRNLLFRTLLVILTTAMLVLLLNQIDLAIRS